MIPTALPIDRGDVRAFSVFLAEVAFDCIAARRPLGLQDRRPDELAWFLEREQMLLARRAGSEVPPRVSLKLAHKAITKRLMPQWGDFRPDIRARLQAALDVVAELVTQGDGGPPT